MSELDDDPVSLVPGKLWRGLTCTRAAYSLGAEDANKSGGLLWRQQSLLQPDDPEGAHSRCHAHQSTVAQWESCGFTHKLKSHLCARIRTARIRITIAGTNRDAAHRTHRDPSSGAAHGNGNERLGNERPELDEEARAHGGPERFRFPHRAIQAPADAPFQPVTRDTLLKPGCRSAELSSGLK